ncbi:hypothetical protein B0H67DRAFT_641765 [Lasiosphaeris hirsuta]|uniref:Exonuclease 1 n=1 Tax=Lasiosphaeris hirsuta TaxID=260670 RepID=A0AA40B0D7_9PEZI|nr:hypothetical protein B0H67DRAFT_641765 [Lasiosphaeris hirsuta]
MGISGLLPLLKSIQRPVDLKKYAGETLGIDGYGWLHRGAIGCAVDLAQGKPTRVYVHYIMHRVRLFKHFGVTPYFVFDGDYLPSKAETEASREKRREASKAAGLALLKAGKPSQAYSELQKAIDVTPEMARHVIEELKKENVPYIVAPYEADAQLVYLERQGLINGIVSEDSDLLVFGAKRLLTKMDKHGQCIEINRKDFCAVREISLTGWSDAEFRQMAIFGGCDYLDSLGNVGLKTAYRLLRKYKTPERVVKALQFEGKHHIPDDYLKRFKQAELTFLYHRVFCPKKRENALLTEPDASVNLGNLTFIGPPVKPEVARAIAAGDVNPITRKAIVIPPSPTKRRISQVHAKVSAPVNLGNRSLGKPINEYFKDRRIPLGEMDPNCFAADPRRENTTAPSTPRQIVFPLPRPYIEPSPAATGPVRPYMSQALRRQTVNISELIGLDDLDSNSSNRRHSAGPSVQVHQDSSSSARPPKKARLCEDLPTGEAVVQTPEKSKFFAPSKPKTRAAKTSDQFLMSDDSIDEAFRTLPDFDSWPPPKVRRSSAEVQIFEEAPANNERVYILPIQEIAKDAETVFNDNVEVPASSPREESVSRTPLSARLQSFSYKRPAATRIVHGLPTPSSSIERPIMSRAASSGAERPFTSRATPQSSRATSILTPLQRIGAQALQREKSRSIPPSSRGPQSSGESNHFGARPSNPALIPLPKVDLAEVEALNNSVGSEDQIIPESDGENDVEGIEEVGPSTRSLNLSRFVYA